MRTFEQLRRYIKENIPDPFKTKKGEGPDFEKNLKKATTKTYKQKGLDLYKAGGPYIPDKEVSQKTGKKVTQQIKKPYFGKPTLPKKTTKAPDRKGLKQAISDVRAGEKRLYDAGVGKKPSLVQQRKFTLSKIKQLSRQTTLKDKLYGSTNVGGGGASGSTKNIKPKTVTPTKPQKSASATDYTKKINQANKNRKEFTGNKKSFQAFKKQADAASDKLVSKREAIRSNPGTKDVKQIRDINKKIKSTQRISKGYDLASKGKGNLKSPVVVASDLKQVTNNKPTRVGQRGFVRKPNKISQGNLFNVRSGSDLMKDFVKNNNINAPDPEADKLRKNIERRKELRKLSNKMGRDNLYKAIKGTKIGKKIVSTKTGKLAVRGTSAVVKAASKNPYTAAAAVVGAGLLTQPNVRKGIKAALAGGGIGALTGAFAKDNRKNKSAEYGKKTYIKKGSISLSPPAPKETNYSKTMSSVKPYDFTKINKKIKADQTAKNNASYAKKNALSASEKQKQRRGIG